MAIYDLFPERSLVRFLRSRGFELYLVDWGRPTRRHDDLGLSSYFAEYLPRLLDRVRAHSGQKKISMHGWSLGGLFALCYAALGIDADIANLVLVGTPFDYYKNGELGRVYERLAPVTQRLRSMTGFGVHQTSPHAFHTPGWFNSLGYKLLTPKATAQNYWQLLKNMHDEELVSAHATNGAVLDDMVAYTGRVNQDVFYYLLMGNVMARDSLPMKDSRGSFTNVHASVLNITGKSDVIVTPRCSQAMRDRLGTNDITFLTIDGGHISVVSGSASQKQSWNEMADWLLARDDG
jgi:polyhydroxyalkanoate synthase